MSKVNKLSSVIKTQGAPWGLPDPINVSDSSQYLNSDTIMNQFIHLRTLAINMLQKDPKKFAETLYSIKGPISIDKNCRNGYISLESQSSTGRDSERSERTPSKGMRKPLTNLFKSLDAHLQQDVETVQKPEASFQNIDLPATVFKRLQKPTNKRLDIEMVARGYTCTHCQSVDSLLRDSFGEQTEAVPIRIEYGAWEGVSVLYVHEKVYPMVEYTEETLETRTLVLTNGENGENEIRKTNSKIVYMGLDHFAARVMINWVIQERFQTHGVRNNTEHLISFVCGTVGTHIVEAPEVSVYSKYGAPDVALACIYQALEALRVLAELDFALITAQWNISFVRSSRKLKIRNRVIQAPLMLLLGDLSNSAITFLSQEGPVRVYSVSKLYREEKIAYNHKGNIQDYKVPTFDVLEEKHIAQRAVGGISKQFGLYLLISELMLVPGFAATFKESKYAIGVLEILFSDTDREIYQTRLSAVINNENANIKDTSLPKTSMDFLRGLTLKAEALEALWGHMNNK